MDLLTACPVCASQKMETFIVCKDHFLTKEEFTIVKCQDCGLKFTNPRPEKAKLGEYYKSAEYISHSNSRKGIFNSVYQKVRRYTIGEKCRMIQSYASGNKLLDVGCATGEFLAFMKLRNWEVLGIEPDANVRKMAIEYHGLNVQDEDYLAKLTDNSMDVITLWHVLEHVADLGERMKELQRILKPGGILILAVPNAESKDAEIYNIFWAAYDVPRHLYHFSRGSMEKLVSRNNLKLEAIKPMKFDAFYVSMLSEKYLHGKMRWVQGFWNGYCSNRKAGKTGDYSSLIFIARKEIII
jgi:2-polyprenyl-3-methyl-5-hydroxy-6-metoxy-1,4-benzoquinol methylase